MCVYLNTENTIHRDSYLNKPSLPEEILQNPYLEQAEASCEEVESFDPLEWDTSLSTPPSPTARYLKTHSLQDTLTPYLDKYGVTKAQQKILDQAAANETDQFFGYHGAKQDFRIFQDIIRFGIEEILHIPIRKDFHFLRVPGDPSLNVNSAKAFLDRHPKDINDDLPLESSQLLSMNFALYEHYWYHDQCSVYFFAKNTNFGNLNYRNKLIPFFKDLGIDSSQIEDAFKIAKTHLPSSGVLFQMFDTSGDYHFVDAQAYLSKVNGKVYFPKNKISKIVTDSERTNFPQFRLILNNENTLNPYSPLAIRRYDLTTPEQELAYEKAMRQYFRNFTVDTNKRDTYHQKIREIWDRNFAPSQLAA